MNQTIHIFKKDLRRFSWEISLSLLVLAVYAWCQPASWAPPETFFANASATAYLRYLGASFIGLIMVLVWMLMMVRLVNEESPAGDRQFWITRPYQWPSLLAAKMLFLIVVINIPLTMVQLVLLKAAGFAPFHNFLNLIYINLGLDALLLAFAALASISGGRTQLTRAAIVALLFLLAWIGLSSWGSVGIDLSFRAHDSWNFGEKFVLISVPLAVIVLQYARRKTMRSRQIMLGGALALLLLSAIEPKSTLNAAEFPLQKAGADFQTYIAPPLETQKNRAVSINALRKQDKFAMIDLRLFGGDVPEGQTARVNAVNITFRAPDGKSWDSGWQSVYTIVEHREGAQTTPGRGWRRLNSLLQVDKDFFDRYKDVPVSAHVETAVTLLRDTTMPLSLQDNELTLPGIGFCEVTGRPMPLYFCRTDLNKLPVLGITDEWFKSCPEKDAPPHPATQRTAWIPGWRGQLGLSPVYAFSPFQQDDNAQIEPQGFCRDTSVIFRLPEKIRKFRAEKDFEGIKLADFLYQ